MEFLVCVRSFNKLTNINELPAERLTNCSLNIRFVYNPIIKRIVYLLLLVGCPHNAAGATHRIAILVFGSFLIPIIFIVTLL
ncbi:hypothetical protein Hanom_Chr09g00783951 [Helianthus anomalus]